ncbi:unnamed protein product [Darwinula stevensoni]|uniref:Thioredoxin domain-containing protein n=1 Tax=Darwinula stevensoni TaxID=69355 RepID=A0A7R8X6H4_9CRUS|nr:unnamed protein product [Darwinula stevensoni]CAG0888117.1 unnamed protein product [Darwinula stevensoni]
MEFLKMLKSVVLVFTLAGICVNGSRVIELTEKFLEIKEDAPWLVKFYAPWCGHCRRLEPVFYQVAQALVGTEIKVGKLDCTRFTSVAQEFSIKGFPTIMFMKGKEVFTYSGDRSKDDILAFAKRLSGPAVKVLATCAHLDAVIRGHDLFFLYVGERTGTLWNAFQGAAFAFQERHSFYAVDAMCLNKLHEPTVVLPAVFVHKDKVYHAMPPVSHDVSTKALNETVYQWINHERFPSFLKVNHGNFYQLLKLKKWLVIAVLEEDTLGDLTNEMLQLQDIIHRLALQEEESFRQWFQFGWMSNPEIANSVAMQNLDIPSILVINATTLQYLLPNDDIKIDESFSESRCADFLKSVLNFSAPVYGGDTYLINAYRALFNAKTSLFQMWEGNPVLMSVLFGLPLGFLSLICYSVCCGDIFEAAEEETLPEPHEKED